MEIRKMKLADLNPAPYNPRKKLQPGDPEYEKLKRSIQTFGYVELIVVNERTGNTVISGHQRLTVLKDLGETEAECVVLDLSMNDEKALNLAMNKISGVWDIPSLTSLLQDLSVSAYDISLTGFEPTEITDLFDDVSEVKEDEPPEPATQEPAITQEGDIWELGPHRLMCGDSTDPDDIDELMGGRMADLLITDPPYNVDYQGGTDEKLKIMNDKMEADEFYRFLFAAFGAAARVLKPGGGVLHMACQHRNDQFYVGGRQGDRSGETGSDLEQERSGTRAPGLQLETRTMPLRMA